MNANDVARVLETVLTIPGMTETVKIDLKISRRNILILSSVIARGLNPKEEAAGLLDNIPEEVIEELNNFSNECLSKAGLSDLNQKLKSLSTK